MGRTRYKIIEPKQPHFITCTILHWLPVFTRPSSVQIIIDCLNYLKNSDGLKLYGFTCGAFGVNLFVFLHLNSGFVISTKRRSGNVGYAVCAKHKKHNRNAVDRAWRNLVKIKKI